MTTTRPERLSPELVAEVQSWLDQDPDEANFRDADSFIDPSFSADENS